MLKRMIFAALLLSLGSWALAQNKSDRDHYVSCTVTPVQHEYLIGQRAMVRVVATAGGRNLHNVPVTFEAGQEHLRPDTVGTACFLNGEALFDMGTLYKPGFRRCKLAFQAEGEGVHQEVTVAFEPQRIRPTVQEPADFDAFWQQTLRKAAKVPLVYELEDDPVHSNDSVLSQKIKYQSYEEGAYIYGYLTRPRDGKPHPVMLRVPGAGVKPIEFEGGYSQRGFVVLSIGVNGIPAYNNDSLLAQSREAIGDYWLSGIESRETYAYRRIYCALVRGIDLLTQLPEWNGRDVAVTGGSQGGALSMVAAGLDRRVTMLMAFYPALCDIGGYARGSVGGWPNIGRPGSKELAVDHELWLRTVGYYDVSVFARRITAPGFYSFGYNDPTCSPTSTCGAINEVKAPKVVVTTPSSGHWRYPQTNRQAQEWAQQQLDLSAQSTPSWQPLAHFVTPAPSQRKPLVALSPTGDNRYNRLEQPLPVRRMRVNSAVTSGTDGTIYYTCLQIRSMARPDLVIEWGQYMNQNHKGRLLVNGEPQDHVGSLQPDGSLLYDLSPYGSDLYVWGMQDNLTPEEVWIAD